MKYEVYHQFPPYAHQGIKGNISIGRRVGIDFLGRICISLQKGEQPTCNDTSLVLLRRLNRGRGMRTRCNRFVRATNIFVFSTWMIATHHSGDDVICRMYRPSDLANLLLT